MRSLPAKSGAIHQRDAMVTRHAEGANDNSREQKTLDPAGGGAFGVWWKHTPYIEPQAWAVSAITAICGCQVQSGIVIDDFNAGSMYLTVPNGGSSSWLSVTADTSHIIGGTRNPLFTGDTS
jgi:hypothetical protein